LPARRTADYAIGAPSLYARKQPVPTVVATAAAGASIGGVAYDNVNQRLIARDRARLLMFDVNVDRMKDGPDAIAVFGQPDFNDRHRTGVGPKLMGGNVAGTVLDERNQRLFATDDGNNRIMVWDIEPSRLEPFPDPLAVLGQKDASSRVAGKGAAGLSRPGSIYYDDANDRLFAVDSGNNRVLVYDGKPVSLKTGMQAMAVIGQLDFDASSPGLGPAKLNRPARILHDAVNQRLFVGDAGNNRVLVFDVHPRRFKQFGMAASYVFGQDTFDTRSERTDLRKAIANGQFQLDPLRQRLYITEAISLNRQQVFDVHPARIRNNPDAISTIFQREQDRIDAMVNQDQETWPRPFLDPQRGRLYVAASHPGGNRVSFFDISGELPKGGLKALTTLGHVDGDGNVDFQGRAGAGRSSGRVFYPRSLALDPNDHRLFVGDQYNNRVLMYQLDAENRIVDRDAAVVFGQPDNYDVRLHEISQRTLKIPFGLAYDEAEKRLFIGDGWHNRVMVFDARPDRLKTFPEAIAVLGQPDYETFGVGASGPNRVDFKMVHPDNRNIGGSGTSAIAMAIDTQGKRLFLSDGGNNRVLVFDTSAGALKPGASAIGVIGQPDLDANDATNIGRPPGRGGGDDEEGGGGGGGGDAEAASKIDPERAARGFNSPAGLAFDAKRNRLFVVDGNNARVLIFDVTPSKFGNGPQAIGVIGQKDFVTKEVARLRTNPATEEFGRRRMNLPSGLAYDPVKDWLYVGDRGNERTLVFDVAPERMGADPGALFVLGKDDFQTDIVTISEQEEIIEPRELAVDAKAQRVYQTDTPMGRVLIFDLPRTEREVALGPRAMMTYSTIDPWNGREDKKDRDTLETWLGKMTPKAGTATPGASIVLTNTKQFRHPLSERRSRVLVSETTIQAPMFQPVTTFVVDGTAGNEHLLVVTNADAKAVDANLTWQAGGARPTQVKRSIAASGRLEMPLSQLFSSAKGQAGVLRVSGGKQNLAAILIRETATSRGETLQMAIPAAAAFESADGAAIAGIKGGAGYGTEIILINTGAKKIEGDLNVLDGQENGEPVQWNGATFPMPYALEAGQVLHLKLTSSSPVAEESYAVVKSRTGNTLPAATAIVSQKKGDLILSQTATVARPHTQLAWVPVDTMPNLIRHGQTPSRMVFSVANSNRLPALVRFTLFDLGGKELSRYEQIMGPNNQRQWTLPDLFNQQQVKGSVRFYSDVPVALSAKRVTSSLRGELVESEQGYTDVNAMKRGSVVTLPLIWDGEGMASEIVLVNPTPEAMGAQLQFNASDGVPSPIVLR
jgi:DNA-binding beta-propeller fold protein YncE